MPTGSGDLTEAADHSRHEDQEHSSPCAHSGNPGICVFVSVLILAMLQDKAMVASKHYLVETEAKSKGVRGSFFLYLPLSRFRYWLCLNAH